MTTEAGRATMVQINVTVNGEEHAEEVEPSSCWSISFARRWVLPGLTSAAIRRTAELAPSLWMERLSSRALSLPSRPMAEM